MCAYLLAYSVLVDGPDGWHVGGKQLILCECGIAGPGTDQPGLAYCIVPHHHTFNGFHIGPLIVCVYIHGEGPKEHENRRAKQEKMG